VTRSGASVSYRQRDFAQTDDKTKILARSLTGRPSVGMREDDH